MINDKKWKLGGWLTVAVVIVLIIEVIGFFRNPNKVSSLYLFINDTPKTVVADVIGDNGAIGHLEIRSQSWQFVILPINLKDGFLDESPKDAYPNCMGNWPCGVQHFNKYNYRTIVPTFDLFYFKLVPLANLPLAEVGFPD